MLLFTDDPFLIIFIQTFLLTPERALFPLILSLVTWEKRLPPHLATTSFQLVIESKKISPVFPFLKAKQSDSGEGKEESNS